MIKPIHIRLLELLEVHGIGKYVDIADFISNEFSIPINQNFNDEVPELFLDDLINRGLIVAEKNNGAWLFNEINGKYVPV